MALSPRTGLYSVYPATFSDSTVTDVTLKQLREVSPNFNPNVVKKKVVGSVDSIATTLMMADPRFRMVTGDIFTCLSDFGLNGQCWDAGVTLPLIERSACGTFRTGPIESWFISDQGYVYIDSISADQNSDLGAVANLEYVPFWDGTNDIVRMTLDNNTAAGTPSSFVSWYWPGPVRWNDNHRLDGVISWELLSNTQYVTKREGGEPFPRRGALRQRDFVCRIRTNKIDAHARSLIDATADWGIATTDPKMSNLFLSSLTPGATAALDLYLQRSVDGGIRVADAIATHARIRCATAHASMSEWSVVAEDDATATYEIHIIGTPAISTSVAIPAAAAEATV